MATQNSKGQSSANQAKRQARKAKRKEGFKQYVKGNLQAAEAMAPYVIGSMGGIPGVAATMAADTIVDKLNGDKSAKFSAVNHLARTVKQLGSAAKNAVAGGFKMLFNHPEWYENYPLNNMVNLNFGYRKSVNSGIKDLLKLREPMGTGTVGDNVDMAASYVVQLCAPVDENNTVRQAAEILYAKIRAANSGSVNYTVQDLLAYILNVRSLRVGLTCARRMLQTIYTTNPYDSDLPKLLTTVATGGSVANQENGCIGIDFDTVTNHAADLHNQLHLWFMSARTLYPLNIDLYNRTDWLFSNIFADSDDDKAHYVGFIPAGLPVYTVNTDGSITVTQKDMIFESTSFEDNYKNYIGTIQSMFDYLGSVNINSIIAGDILKAFGDSAFYTQEVGPLYTPCYPIYDEAALTQIQNSVIAGGTASSLVTETFTANGDHSILFDRVPNLDDILQYQPSATLVNTYKDSVTPGEAIAYTRFAFIATQGSNANTYIMNSCGTEFILDVWYYHTKDANGKYNIAVYHDISLVNTSTLQVVMNGWSIIDYSPLMSFPIAKGTFLFLWDANNYAVCDAQQLSQFHQYAILSLLAATSNITRQNKFQFVE